MFQLHMSAAIVSGDRLLDGSAALRLKSAIRGPSATGSRWHIGRPLI